MNQLSELPRPSADQALYSQTLEAGFAKFPERKLNYDKYKASRRGELLDYLPIKLDIENVSRCNYRCTMCEVSNWPGQKRAEDMSFEDYKDLIDSQYGLIEIKLQGLGEPLMGECYFEMIEYTRSKHIWVRSTTNGSLLRLRDNYKRLIETDICELQVSVDGASPNTYEKIRRGGKFTVVAKNIALLNQYARDVNRLRTRMWTVVQKDNFHELEQFPALAAELGFDRLTFSLQLNNWGLDSWAEINEPIDMHKQFTTERGLELVEAGKRLGLSVTFWSINEKYETGDPSKICAWPFERALVSSDMRIVPCCIILNPEVSDMGDARNFSSEWHGPKMVEFRRAHLAGQVPTVCRSCYKD